MGSSVNKKDLDKLIAQIDKLLKPPGRKVMDLAARTGLKIMKAQIESGISPIEGMGRFPGYKNEKRYPGKKKPARPVNLRLSGDMMQSLKGEAIDASSLDIDYDNQLSLDKEQGHRDGVGGQPKRPTLPEGNENFSRVITQAAEDVVVKEYERRISELK